jgi:stress response protein SCP2
VSEREGEIITLSQGQEVTIRRPDRRTLTEISVGVGWDPAKGAEDMDVDSSVVLLSEDNRQMDLVYFMDKEHETGCVIHHGDNLTGEGDAQDGDDENISVYLTKVPKDRDKLVFVLNIYNCDRRGQTLDKVRNDGIVAGYRVACMTIMQMIALWHQPNCSHREYERIFKKVEDFCGKALKQSEKNEETVQN